MSSKITLRERLPSWGGAAVGTIPFFVLAFFGALEEGMSLAGAIRTGLLFIGILLGAMAPLVVLDIFRNRTMRGHSDGKNVPNDHPTREKKRSFAFFLLLALGVALVEGKTLFGATRIVLVATVIVSVPILLVALVSFRHLARQGHSDGKNEPNDPASEGKKLVSRPGGG